MFIMTSRKITSIEFEIFGRVQGVFFRKHTEKEAKKLGLSGWCMNTESGTVKGVMEGEEQQVAAMKKWLKETGSPQSRIDTAEFKNEQKLDKKTFSDFKIRR